MKIQDTKTEKKLSEKCVIAVFDDGPYVVLGLDKITNLKMKSSKQVRKPLYAGATLPKTNPFATVLIRR